MSAVTYSDPQVIDTINARFVPMQINTQEAAGLPLVQRFYQVWTPDLRVVAPEGGSLPLERLLPPAEFLPQLLVAQAYACLRLHDEPGAAAVYREVTPSASPPVPWPPRRSTSLPSRPTSRVTRPPTCWTTGTASRCATLPVSGG